MGEVLQHPVSLGASCSWEKTEDPGILCSLEERELATNVMYPYDVTGSRDFWVYHYEFHL